MQFSSALLENAVNEFAKLPGIGKKTALRLVLHLLKEDGEEVLHFSEVIARMRSEIKFCQPIRLGQNGLETKRYEFFFEADDLVPSRTKEIDQTDMRKGLDMCEIVPVLPVTVIIVRLNENEFPLLLQ